MLVIECQDKDDGYKHFSDRFKQWNAHKETYKPTSKKSDYFTILPARQLPQTPACSLSTMLERPNYTYVQEYDVHYPWFTSSVTTPVQLGGATVETASSWSGATLKIADMH